MPVSAEGPNSRAVRTRQVVITNDYWNTKLQGKGQIGILVGPDNGLRPQSSLVVPMMTMGRVVGTVEVQSYEDDAYRPEHVTAMRMAANLAAVAVENMRLLRRGGPRGGRGSRTESGRVPRTLSHTAHPLSPPLWGRDAARREDRRERSRRRRGHRATLMQSRSLTTS